MVRIKLITKFTYYANEIRYKPKKKGGNENVLW